MVRQESERGEFSVIGKEKRQRVSFRGLPFHLVIDRIDRLADGSFVIIDYKTGGALSIADWFSDRPDEPQLPLYVCSQERSIDGIYFAKISAKEEGFIGIHRAESRSLFPEESSTRRIKPITDWNEQIQRWRQGLEKLADDFKRGDARVDPKSEKSCQFCPLHTLCRIDLNST